MRSGFVSIVGRTGVGKSTLLNRIIGEKVTVASRHKNTTRTPVRGILHSDGAQVVFVDTPGFHKPKTVLGQRLNSAASGSIPGADVVCFVVDATQPIGKGDESVASRIPKSSICVLNKIDRAPHDEILRQLARASQFGFSEYFPVSSRTGRGVDELVHEIVRRMPEGPEYFPEDMISDYSDEEWIAELVREELLKRTREELPHSVACQVTEVDWPRVRCEILVERDSQKPIVVGKGGQVLKEVGTAVRKQMPDGAFLELFVRVEKGWQGRTDVLDRLGYNPK